MTVAVADPPTSKSAEHTSSYIPSLDGLRAVPAFLLVFLSHTGRLGEWIPGKLGVTIFFFLSGYLITTLLRREGQKTGRISLKHFYLRRVLRILPPMYLAIALGVLFTQVGLLHQPITGPGVLVQIFHAANYGEIRHVGGMPEGTFLLWSLAVEEHFYLLFPLLYIFMRTRCPAKTQALVMLAVCGIVLAWRYFLVCGLNFTEQYTGFATDTRIDSILFGCILGVWENPVMDRSNFSDRTWKYVLFPTGLALMLLTLVIRGETFRETIRYTLQGMALFPVFVAAVRYPNWFLFPLVNLSWVRFLGILSYSMYLIHNMILLIVEHQLPYGPLVQGIVGFVLTVGLSTAIYYAIEKPCLRLRRKLSHS